MMGGRKFTFLKRVVPFVLFGRRQVTFVVWLCRLGEYGCCIFE